MELQWNQKECQYLRSDIHQVQNLEQTQELRLPEGMPDIGRVLCAWGQPVIQSKQWHSESISVSGGVTAWVLYAPEDGSEARSVELWLPFTGRWTIPDSRREGTIRACCQLRNVDARTLSSRKLMVRAAVGILAEAAEMAETAVFSPDELPEDVQLLQQTYPAMLPREAGEKLFTLEQALPMDPMPRKILSCDVQNVVSEQTAAGSKAVFRGNCRVHLVFMGEDDRLGSSYFDLPFAQFAELDRDYDKDACADVMLAVTGLETQMEADQLIVQCSMVGQYIVYERKLLTVVEDAYSPCRPVQGHCEPLQLPMLLEQTQQQVESAQEMQLQNAQVVDVSFQSEFPAQYRDGNSLALELPGIFQVLYYDADGELRAEAQNVLTRMELPAGSDCSVSTAVFPSREPGYTLLQDKIRLECSTYINLVTTSQQQIPMLTGLEIGEQTQLDPDRPSLILQRPGDQSLWELAKACGSTVEAIRTANQLIDDPEPCKMLLIPVI